jgi:hypothetical protein
MLLSGRALWLKEGDKCTNFFHRMANSNRRNNSIESQLVNGPVSSDQTEIKEHIVHFYVIVCFLNSSVGSPNWMALLLIPLIKRMPLG